MPKLTKVSLCEGCPVFETGDGRCTALGSPVCDVYILGGVPDELMPQSEYTAFRSEKGIVYNSIVTSVKKINPKFLTLKTKMHHAAHCYDPKMNTAVVQHCSSLVRNDIFNSNAKVVLALGAEAMKSLGIKGTVGDMRGQELFINIGNKTIPLVISFAPGALNSKAGVGKLPTAKADIKMALEIAAFGKRQRKTIAELTKDYTICKTPDEFKKLVDDILAYPSDLPDGTLGPSENNLLAIDTETAVENNKYSSINTWVPGFKIIALSVSWAKGKSAAVVLDHKLNPHSYEDYVDDIKRLLGSPNPKTFHNWKYDCKVLELAYPYKVNNVMFDSQMGEYLLDENKAGEYGLKKITKNRVPDFYGYEKMLKNPAEEAIKAIAKAKDDITTIIANSKEKKEEAKLLRLSIKDLNASKKGLTKKKNPDEIAKIEEDKEVLTEELDVIKESLEAFKVVKGNLKKSISNYKDIIEELKTQSFEDIDLDTMLLYAAIDTDITRQVSKQQISEIKKDSTKLFGVLGNIMLPAARVLAEMEHVGVKIDLGYVEELKIHFEKVIEENKEKVYAELGVEINLNSPAAIIDVLVGRYGVKLTKKTKSGQFSTDAAVMEELAKDYKIAKLILEYKKAYKARHTFLKGILEGGKSPHDYGCSIDGRIHGNYNQTIAATGRLSSSAPNLQNIPAEILGMNIKKMMIPDGPEECDGEEQVFVQVDYSAAEVRVMTAYAPDKELIRVLDAGMDMHSFVGSNVFAAKGIYNTPGVSYEDLFGRERFKVEDSKEFNRLNTMRQISKMVMFLTIYGGGAFTLKANLEKAGTNLGMEECEGIMAMLLKKFPAIKTYMRIIKNTVNKYGEVQTYTGRKRRFPIARFSYKMKRAAYREAINSPIQGTSSDIVLRQMCDFHAALNERGYKKVLRGTVHDSVFFQFPKKDLHLLVDILDEFICDRVNKNFPWLPVKFAYDVEFGPSYGEAKTNLKKVKFDKKTA